MKQFWQWLIEFFVEHWQDLAIGGGVLFSCLRTAKTKEEKEEDKLKKVHDKNLKLELKLKKGLEKECELEKGGK